MQSVFSVHVPSSGPGAPQPATVSWTPPGCLAGSVCGAGSLFLLPSLPTHLPATQDSARQAGVPAAALGWGSAQNRRGRQPVPCIQDSYM